MGSRAHFIKLTISGNYYGNKASQPISTKDSTEVYIGSKLPLMVSFMQWGPVLCNLFINFSLLSIANLCFNPIPTGGGGGQFDPPPPLHKIRDCLATRLFMSFFFQVLRIFSHQVCENRTIGREVTWRFVLARRHKIAQNLHVCVQNTWKWLIFLKCAKTVFLLSLGPFSQFLISWN